MNTPANSTTRGTKDPERLLAGKRAFIIDDEDEPTTILKANLSKYGVLTRSFNRAIPALEYIKEDPPDILYLDIMMPDMDGWEFYTILRTELGLHTLPVLFVTCLTEHDIEKDMEQEGLCATLSKPIFRDQLIEKTMQLLCVD